MMQFSDGWIKRGKNATVSGFRLFLHCQYKICLMRHIGRCAFHFKCRLLLFGLPAAAKSSLNTAMHRVQNSAIIRINKI